MAREPCGAGLRRGRFFAVVTFFTSLLVLYAAMLAWATRDVGAEADAWGTVPTAVRYWERTTVEENDGWRATVYCSSFGCSYTLEDIRPPAPILPSLDIEPDIIVPWKVAYTVTGQATHYGESYNGQVMGCRPHAPYWSSDSTIVAVSPDRYVSWPCGTEFRIHGPVGSIYGYRQDSCPGCRGNHVDLSEAGFAAVCGAPYIVGRCAVEIEVLR